jgi:tRNA (guanine-N7-)-methyltransferase
MGRKNKLQRFSEIAQFENVFEYTDFEETEPPKGRWKSRVFENENPIVLELACGKGEYTIYLAEKHPDKNFIGIDLKGARIWKGAKYALEKGFGNVHFIRMFIDHLEDYFSKGEVDEIWITFPDPYPRKSKVNKRLTSPKFLAIYRNVLKPGKPIHLKTDSDKLYQFTLETIQEEDCKIIRKVDDVYREAPEDELLTNQTFYEKQHLEDGRTIHYVKFSLL